MKSARTLSEYLNIFKVSYWGQISLWILGCGIFYNDVQADWPESVRPQYKCGIDVVCESLSTLNPNPDYVNALKNKRIGLIINQTSRTRTGSTSLEALNQVLPKYGAKITTLFELEHGSRGIVHANEALVLEDLNKEWAFESVFSLYGSDDISLRPTEAMLDCIDTLVYDIADVGTRCYTYASSLYYFMKCVQAYNAQHPERQYPISILVLDRPNPINGCMVEGPLVDPQWYSFIGPWSLPVCHGMTLAELAQMYQAEVLKTTGLITAVPMQNYERAQVPSLMDISWVPSSPNMPALDTTRVYPITVIGEGLVFLNIGKQSQQPFQYMVAPELDGTRWAATATALLNKNNLKGVRVLDYHTKPLAGSYQDQMCSGIRIEVVDPMNYQPVAVQYVILEALQATHPKFLKQALKNLHSNKNEAVRIHCEKALSNYHQACWLMGTDTVLLQLMNGNFDACLAIKSYQAELELFKNKRKHYLMYE